ncbi:helix-turn-helix domain-containing protein [Lacimicrobium alkaliphilum]|uniref:HTH araC/xylS-type domain-containing protein n=1 Tax=Lacimicrobium alkaliphilum TaxID=1526571 RepID=A0ABQ1RCQ7_9ALTE|nr:helix-turn-helix transcriptional regulator [Lacimicrobium alkaliphilum]GGD66035.1 hypothetical protein GCM10011357_21590 [Lacimicrobium alkaliphilum]
MTSKTCIPSGNIELMQTMMASVDVSLARLMRQLHIQTDEPGLEIIDFLRLQEAFALEVGDESWHMSKRPLLPGTNDYVLASLGHCQHLNDALKQLALSYNVIHGGNYNQAELSERHLEYIIDDREFPYLSDARSEYIQFNLESVLLYVHGIICALLPDKPHIPLLKIYSRAPATKHTLLQSVLNATPIKSEASCYALRYANTVASEPLDWQRIGTLTSAKVYSELQRRIIAPSGDQQHQDFLEKVRQAINSDYRSQDAVADYLGCSGATLRRKLAEYQTSFRAVKEQVLDHQAKTLLSAQLAIEDVALALGFSDVRSFNRAFKSWNGLTPKEYSLTKRKNASQLS